MSQVDKEAKDNMQGKTKIYLLASSSFNSYSKETEESLNKEVIGRRLLVLNKFIDEKRTIPVCIIERGKNGQMDHYTIVNVTYEIID